MKLLENTQFEVLSSSLSTETNVCNINARIESYSCKMAGDYKRSYKHLHVNKSGTSPASDIQILGPPQTTQHQLGCSPSVGHSFQNTTVGSHNNQLNLHTYMHSQSLSDDPDSQLVSMKTLFYLRSTLNSSFHPDYDFSNTPSNEFSKEPSFEFVLKAIENCLGSFDVYKQIKQQFWDSIDKEINLNECEIYSYNPDLSSDPYGEDGSLWFFNYFFYNKKMKRIVFFSCRCTSKSINASDSDNEDLIDMDYNTLDNDDNKMIGFVYSI